VKTLLVIGPEPPPVTGMEVATRAMIEELRAAGVPLLRVDTADPDDELGNRARWTWHNVSLGLRHLAEAARLSFRRDVGAVYLPITQEFPGFYRDAAFILIARVARKPVIVHLHGGAFAGFVERETGWKKTLILETVGKAAKGIVLSEALRFALECVLPRERVVAVLNGVDLPQATVKRVDDGTVVVFFLSTLFVNKGILHFLEAFAQAHAERPELRASVAGHWPDAETQAKAEALIERLGIAHLVTFHGTVEGVRKSELFGLADLFCFPSIQTEGQPLVIIEAMAAGLPVVTSDGPGMDELVVEGETGLRVPVDRDALASALARLGGDPAARAAMGAAGRQRYEQVFTKRAFGRRMLQVVGPLVGRPVAVPDERRAA
jgi:glycosyltransferase involved in cell wall biosynthesis